jgi:transcriptional regulator with XRE-family HTH domain
MDSFGEYLHGLRKRKGLTLKQVEAAGVASNAYLSQLERGRRKPPHLEILKGLAAVYEVPLKDLLVAAGYLPQDENKEPSTGKIESAFGHISSDPRMSFGTRKKAPKLSLEAKKYIVQMYEKLTGQDLL